MKKLISLILIVSLDAFGQSCFNSDFESSPAGNITSSTQVNGWTIYSGVSNLSVTAANCTISSTTYSNFTSAVINASNFGDSNIGLQYTLYSVFGTSPNGGNVNNPSIGQMYGNSFVRLGNHLTPSRFDHMSKRMKVTPMNTIFRYAYVFAGSGAHDCCDASIFRVNVTNITTNSLLTNFNYSVTVPNLTVSCHSDPTIQFYLSGTNMPHTPYAVNAYTKWKIIDLDLSPFIGDSINISFFTASCIFQGHYAYVYLDTECSNASIYINGNIATLPSYSVCNSATLSASPNFNYLWNGPASSTISNITTQSVTATVSGIYTLNVMSGTNTIGTQTLDLTVNNSSNINVTADNYTVCVGGASNLTVTGTGVVSYTWSNNQSIPIIQVNPSVTTVYGVTVTNNVGCESTGAISVNVLTCTSISETRNGPIALILYPNPSNGSFVLQTRTDEIVLVFDVQAKLLQTIKLIDENSHEQKLSGFKPGIYFIRSRERVFKLIVTE